MYEPLKTMYPGGNCVNLCAYAKRFGVEKSAYMRYFGNDDNAEYVIKVLEEIGIEKYKCKQLDGENGWSKFTLKDADRVFVDWNEEESVERHHISWIALILIILSSLM